MAASYSGHASIVDILLRKGANIDIKSTFHGIYSTALTVAARRGHSDCVKLLLEAGANEDPQFDKVSGTVYRTKGHFSCVLIQLY